MLRYIELEPPKNSSFRQAKILSIEVSEGDTINVGEPLLILQIGGTKDKTQTPLPSTHAGRVTEIMVEVGETIHSLSSIVLLETEVKEETTKSKAADSSLPTATTLALEPSRKRIKEANSKANSETKAEIPDQSTQASIEGLNDFAVVDTRQEARAPTVQFDLNGSHADTQISDTSSINTNKNITTENTWKKTMNEIRVPDLGGASEVEVIDILVKIGDTVNADSPLLTVESDKASMDIPSPSGGIIEAILIKVGDTVSEGDVILKITGEEVAAVATTAETQEAAKTDSAATPVNVAPVITSEEVNVTIPDLGGANDVDVIDLLVAVGDTVEADQAIITVESDKASMDVPTSTAGVVTALKIAVGDSVNEGDVVMTVSASGQAVASNASPATAATMDTPAQATTQTAKQTTKQTTTSKQQGAPSTSGNSHASPSIRRFARELGVDLSKVTGTARKSRISKDDVKSFVKGVMTSNTNSTGASTGAGIPEVPAQDFSKFGDIEVLSLNKIKRVTAAHLHRSWLNVPHVTHNDESNVASLEEFRKTLNTEYAKQKKNVKLSPLAFIVKAVVNALKAYPQFNSSLENGGENLILKNYYNVGIAVETPNGLVVPVIRDADKLSLAEIALEMGNLAKKARDGKLTANDMAGGTFTISSLGGIGGTHFTPIVNAPEVAILGVSRTKMQPVWTGSEFIPAPILPLSLSYDHRVIDGAEAARFTRHIAAVLEDLRRLAL